MGTKIEEIWKDVVGYEGLYQVSKFGKVKHLPKPSSKYIYISPMIPSKAGAGYYYVTLCRNKDDHKPQGIHRLVAKAWIPNPENKPCVNHKNGIKTDNHVDNLEWCTYKENTAHAIKTGLHDRLAYLKKDLFIKCPYCGNSYNHKGFPRHRHEKHPESRSVPYEVEISRLLLSPK